MSIDTEFFGGQPPRWVSGTTYPFGFIALSTISPHAYERIVAGAGATDPSADPTNWRRLGAGGIKSIQRGVLSLLGASTTATATISSVDVNKTTLRLLGFDSNAGSAPATTSGSDLVRIALTNSTTITASRATGIGSSPNVSWELEERW